MSQPGRDFDKQGFSYMDGVPVKISERYKPPKKYNLPVGFMQKLPTITGDYDFQLEKSVLEKIREWRKIRNDAIEDRRRRIEAEDQSIQELAEKMKELSVNSPPQPAVAYEEDSNVKEPPTSSSMTESPESVVVETPVIPSEKDKEHDKETCGNVQMVTPYRQMILTQSNQYANCSILTPTPYGSFLNQKKDMAQTSFNLSDFEADTSSPFDNMELKTINDMEELAYVLQPMSPNVKEVPVRSNHPEFSYYNPNMAVNPAQNRGKTQVSTSLTSVQPVGGSIIGKTMPQINGITNYTLYSTVPRNQMQLANQIRTNEVLNGPYREYEGLNYRYPIETMQGGGLFTGNPHEYYSRNVSANASSSSISGIRHARQDYSVNAPSTVASDLMMGGKSRPMKNVDNNNMYALPVSFYFAPSNQVPHSNDEQVASNTTSKDSRSLRASKSVPDIMKELETELNRQPVYQTSQRNSCNTPPVGEQRDDITTSENWRPWPNLDCSDTSTPVLDSVSASCSSKIVTKPNLENPKTVSSLPNPLTELSSSAQRLVHHISEMGFSVPRVARACQIFGDDDKKIIEFLLQVQSLEEKNYPGDLVEQSLITNDYNEEEAISYMKLVTQLMDLGFTMDQVIKALDMNENDSEKALDYLVS